MTEQVQVEQEATPGKAKTAHLLGKLSLVVAISSLGIALYSTHVNSHLKTDNANLNHELSQLQKQQLDLQSRLKQNQQSWQNQQQQLSQDLQGLSHRLQTSLAEQHFDNQDWKLHKARFCLELAQINAHWSHNNQATLALLQQADQILTHLKGHSVFAVRQAIAKEMNVIQNQPTVDQAGLLSQLDSASYQVAQLPVLVLPPPQQSESGQQKSPSAWRAKLDDSIHMLEKLVVVRHHEQDFQPMLSPMYQAVVRESIRMDIQQAQWAILQGNQAIYLQTLQQAQNRIKGSFDNQAKNTINLLATLKQLSQVKIKINRAHVDQSLPLLDQLIQQNAKTQPNKGEEAHD